MSKFNAGDSVRVVLDHSIWLSEGDDLNLPHDAILKAVNYDDPDLSDYEIWVGHLNQWPDDFELVSSITQEDIVRDESDVVLGVYRPNLEDRKVGKVRVELVDKGFPNALWEVARLMTKAQEVKGYADHDWKNLPNWQESFPAAASRHRMKHNKGEFFDDEFEDFKILHKVNEAFNVLAELELMIVKSTHE